MKQLLLTDVRRTPTGDPWRVALQRARFPIEEYLKTNKFGEEFELLNAAFTFLILVMLCVCFERWMRNLKTPISYETLKNSVKEPLKYSSFGFSLIIVMLLSAGVVLHVLEGHVGLGLDGFNRVGLFTIALSVFVISGIPALVLQSFYDNKRS